MGIDKPCAFLECPDLFPEECNIEFAVVDSDGIHI
jgi:hypothetical protein